MQKIVFLLLLLVNLNVFSAIPLKVPTTKVSYFELDDAGDLKRNQQGLPYEARNEFFHFLRPISPEDTAFVVIDPWVDFPSAKLNQYYKNALDQKIKPLTQKAVELGYPVFVFTSDCKAIKPVPYSCRVDKLFYDLAEQTDRVHILFWQTITTGAFVERLKQSGIKHLIYMGFASNKCVISRPTGLVKMAGHGFSLYFIPEASRASETKATWYKEEVHQMTTLIISQSMAELIHYDDINRLLSR